MRSLHTWGLSLAAVAALGGMGGFLVVRGLRAGEAVAPLLAAALDDPDFGVRTSAGKALAEIGPAAVDPLLGALTVGGETSRVLAAEALGLMQPPASAALAPLAAALADPVPRVADE